MSIPQQFIDDLNRDMNLADLIGQYVQLTQKGNSFVGLCPFHAEKTPSFNVMLDKGFYYCFGCGAAGSALRFLMQHVHGNDFIAAVRDLAGQLGRALPSDGAAVSRQRAPVLVLLATLQEHFQNVLLHKAPQARAYLKERGLGKQTAQQFGLGYAPADGGLAALGTGAKDKLLLAAGIVAKSRENGPVYPYFRNRITFPIDDTAGKVIGFGGRVINAGEPKYLNSPQSEVFDKGRIVYGLRQATAGFKEHGFALVVEGYMDVVMLAEHGVRNAVATMGTAATPSQLRSIFTRANRVVFCFDGDNAGRAAASKALNNLMPVLADGKEPRFAFLSQGEDPDSYVRANGATGLLDFLEGALSLEQMLVQPPEVADFDKLDTVARAKLWRRAAGLLEAIDVAKAPFLKAELYSQLAAASGIGVEELHKAARQMRVATAVRRPVTPSARHTMDVHEIYKLLVCLAAQPRLSVKAVNVPLYCSNKRDIMLCKQVIEMLENARVQGQPADVIAYLKAREHRNLANQLKQSLVTWQEREFTVAEVLQQIIAHMYKEEERHIRLQGMRERMPQA